jgi:pimeloyl-ACP methyl ester carboxylesterase
MADFELPVTRYATSGDVNIAYQTMGTGPVDIIMVPGFISHVEFMHELPGYTAFLRRLSTFARVVTFDKRGQGLSDRISGAPSLEQRMDDVCAVMDDVGSRRAVIVGFSEGGAMSVLFAATYPERVAQLVLFGSFAALSAFRPGDPKERIARIVKTWGTADMMKTVIPSQTSQDAINQFAKLERLSASPGAVRTLAQLNVEIDVRSILPAVQVPTLVLHRNKDARVPIEGGYDLAAKIPNARFIEYPGGDHAFWSGDTGPMLGDIEELSQDIATIHRANLSGFWRQYFLPTSLIRPAARLQWAIRLGDSPSTITTTLRSRRLISTAEIWSRVQATAFWRRSMDPAERSDALWRSGPPHSKSVYRCAQVFTPVKSRLGARILVA